MEEMDIVQFAPLQSFVSPTFWHKLADIKLHIDRLSDSPKPIWGYYTNRNAKQCLLEVDYTAFNKDFKAPKFCFPAHGTIYNKNTIEEFKECDKNALLTVESYKILESFKNDNILEDPSLLARFFVLSFADLKNHYYYFWFCFPCVMTPTLSLLREPYKLKDIPALQNIEQILENKPEEQKAFFVIDANGDEAKYMTIKEFLSIYVGDIGLNKFYFTFADASEFENPSWMMRSYAAFLHYKCPLLVGKQIKFLGLRFDHHLCANDSLIWEVLQKDPTDLNDPKLVGWEPNRNHKMGPRMVSMRDTMDSAKLTENSINLNLKLMKWRMLPNLNLEIISETKCLLFGAGTLGCGVARNLLSWGFKHITLLDNGYVSYANPVRQNLYTHGDACAGNLAKATMAAKHLKEINPNAITTGYVIQIPMPGHTIGESLKSETNEDLNKIKELIQQHDVLFLLTDSRESRWLPTLLGAVYNKIVMNAALGFDTYLVMRHGAHGNQNDDNDTSDSPSENEDLKCINGNSLGCYFCNDITAPGNSIKERTLDQQCTVTRPGVSNIAASYVVELLVSLLQHPLRHAAPAYYSSKGLTKNQIPEGLLGVIPHSIRGMLFNYENILPATEKFSQCIACSEKVLSAFNTSGNEFLFKAFETAKYLEDLTGISEFKELDNEIIDFDDSDLDFDD